MPRSVLFAAAAALLAAAPLRAADTPALADGNWVLSYVPGPPAPPGEARLALLKVETKDGKRTAAGSNARGTVKVEDFRVEGKNISVTVDLGIAVRFEGAADPNDAKRVRGSLDVNGRPYFAT